MVRFIHLNLYSVSTTSSQLHKTISYTKGFIEEVFFSSIKFDILSLFLVNNTFSYLTMLYCSITLQIHSQCNKITTWVQDQRKFAIDEPWARRARGLSMQNLQWPRTRSYICCIHHNSRYIINGQYFVPGTAINYLVNKGYFKLISNSNTLHPLCFTYT